jgi:hypothetical protein
MLGGTGDYQEAGDERNNRDARPTAYRRRRPAKELERFDLAASDAEGYEGEVGDDAVAEADEKGDSTQNEEE